MGQIIVAKMGGTMSSKSSSVFSFLPPVPPAVVSRVLHAFGPSQV